MAKLIFVLVMGVFLTACNGVGSSIGEVSSDFNRSEAIKSSTSSLKFYLVDADSNQVVSGPYQRGDVINVHEVEQFSIMVMAPSGTSRVVFRTGDKTWKTEKMVPYAACGDTSGDYVDCRPKLGRDDGVLAISAQAYSSSGRLTSAESIQLDYDEEIIVVEPTPEPAPIPEPPQNQDESVLFQVINSDTNQVIGNSLAAGSSLSLNSLSKTNFTAEFSNINYDSVRFVFSTGFTKVEGKVPYAACGDSAGNFADCNSKVTSASNLQLTAIALLNGVKVEEGTLDISIGAVVEEPAPEPTPEPTPPVAEEPAEDPEENPPSTGRVFKTADLGWKSGENVTQKLTDIFKTLRSGDELYLGHMYKLDDTGLKVPEGVTLRAVKGGGFDFLNMATSSKRYLEFQSGNRLINLTITDSNAENAKEPEVRTNNKMAMRASGKNLQIIDTYIYLSSKTHIRMAIEDSLIKRSHFKGGYYQLNITVSDNIRIEDSLFSESFGDGIKTLRARGNGSTGFTVVNTVYENNWRDGIDTTGGFRDSVVDSCIFRNNGVSGLDIKNIYEKADDFQLGTRGNDNILIKNSEFIDNGNAIVLTTIDRSSPQTINDQNHKNYMPHDIFVEDSIFDNTSSSSFRRAWLIKDAYSIYWDNIQLLGNMKEARVFGPRDLSKSIERTRPDISRTNYNLVGTNVKTGPTRGKSTGYPFNSVGPR